MGSIPVAGAKRLLCHSAEEPFDIRTKTHLRASTEMGSYTPPKVRQLWAGVWAYSP